MFIQYIRFIRDIVTIMKTTDDKVIIFTVCEISLLIYDRIAKPVNYFQY